MAMDIGRIQTGWDVYGSDGDKVGDVSDVGPNYLLVTKGFLFTKDIYIPTSAVSGVEEDRVYLSVAKDQIDGMGWDQPPTDTGSADYGTTGSTMTTGVDDTTTTQTVGGAGAAGTTGYTDTDTGTTSSDYVVGQETTATTSQTGYVDTGAQAASTSNVQDDDTLRVRRYEEDLSAQTVQREAGAVRVEKDVVEEQRNIDVPVTHEEVHVRSRQVDAPASATGEAFQEGVIEVPVREEDVVVNKEARVAEELEIEKRAVTETQRVSDTVRKEVVDVEQVGDVDVEGGTSGTTRRS